jgi:hypothetical protein
MTRETGVEGLMASNGALPRMAKLLAIPLDEILAIDDGDNDIAMFEWSGLSIFMGNASPEVWRGANVVTGSYGEDGFANAVAAVHPRRSFEQLRWHRPEQASPHGRARACWVENLAHTDNLSQGTMGTAMTVDANEAPHTQAVEASGESCSVLAINAGSSSIRISRFDESEPLRRLLDGKKWIASV